MCIIGPLNSADKIFAPYSHHSDRIKIQAESHPISRTPYAPFLKVRSCVPGQEVTVRGCEVRRRIRRNFDG